MTRHEMEEGARRAWLAKESPAQHDALAELLRLVPESGLSYEFRRAIEHVREVFAMEEE